MALAPRIKILLLLFGLLATLTLAGCSSLGSIFSRNDTRGPVIGYIDANPYYYTDLKAGYQPVGTVADTLQELKQFLPSFLDYEAKILEAQKNGLFEDSALNAEYREFGKRAAYAYWTENDIKEQILQTYMQRAQEELLVSYMLITLKNDASPQDTLRAYNKLLEARQKIIEGADFDSLSNIYSSKSRGRSAGGELYYITAGTTVLPFEDQIYNLDLMEVSMPFRSRFGMHLAMVKDRRPRKADRHLSHILIFDENRNYTPEVQDSLVKSLEPVYDQLINGASWDSLAAEVSQDKSSSNKGGQIGWVNYGRYNEVFSDSAMNMTAEAGSITRPFYSGYGGHILKLDSIRTFSSKQQEKDFYREELAGSDRLKTDDSTVREKIRPLLSINIDSVQVGAFIDSFKNDSTKIKALNIATTSTLKPSIQVGDLTYTKADILSFFQERYPELMASKMAWSMVNELVDAAIDEHVLDISRQKFPEFDKTMRNYRNGLAVFKITEDSVWNYAKQDTAALQALFEQQPQNYQLPERVEYIRFAALADSVLTQAKDLHQQGLAIDSILNTIDQLIIHHDSTSYLDEQPFEPLKTLRSGEYSEIYSYKGRKTLIFEGDLLDARPMRFDEAIYRVISDYQLIREQAWTKDLRARYAIQPLPENIPIGTD